MPEITNDIIAKRIIRFAEMMPCKTAFIDARTPGSDKKENFCLIGDGVAENPDQIVHIDIPHGFNIGAARQPKGCKNSHHSHDTEEVFMIFSGDWKFTWGECGEDGNAILSAGDTISLPSNMFRGFEYVGEGEGLMYSILGLNSNGSAGRVLWAPYVFEQAKDYGLVLLEDGRLIDTAAGKTVPADGVVTTPTSQEEVESLDRLNIEDMLKCVVNQDALPTMSKGGLSKLNGISEFAVIGISNEHEAIEQGKMAWPHGFHLRRLQLEPGAKIEQHKRYEEEVIIVHRGSVDVMCENQPFTLNKGDLFSAPKASARQYSNNSNELTDLWVVRGGNNPRPADFS